MSDAYFSWVIVAAPAAAFVVIAVFCRKGKAQKYAPLPLLLALAAAGAVALSQVFRILGDQSATGDFISLLTWVDIPQGGLTLNHGIFLNPLSAVMASTVCIVSFCVQLYSVGYMKGEDGYGRYFAYMALFTTSMLGLVLASNLLLVYFFWELVGICSYFLIGFFHRLPSASSAATKAFVVTRFGDVGFLIAILIVLKQVGSFDLQGLQTAVEGGKIAAPWLTLIAVGLFAGAMGKSAQFPLHVWLPDAMEGPTPVSALIHAATMVAAGVYLISRTFFVFEASGILPYVALIGGFTAFMAATIALVQTDIKRVLAYSTISQLGYMVLALGAGSVFAAMLHLTTHAFFKALLFLTAGSVIHAVHTNEMPDMGGLWPKMKTTAVTTAIGGLALAGIFPLSGFFSKEAILASVEHAGDQLGAVAYLGLAFGLVTVFLTAFYMARLWAMTFLGKARSEAARKAHESPPVMTIPLLILAGLSIVGAALAFPGLVWLFEHLADYAPPVEHSGIDWLAPMTWAGLAIGVLGVVIGFSLFRSGATTAAWERKLPTVARFCRRLWYFDEFYQWLARRVVLAVARMAAWYDRAMPDGMVNGAGWLIGRLGAVLRTSATGQLQFYAFIVLAAVAVGVAVLFWWAPWAHAVPVMP